MEGVSNGQKKTIFIEAKFLSDISYQIKYNPVRDQIVRNIDCGIDYIKKKMNNDFNNFYFFLLTPKIFRTNEFNPSHSGVKHNPIGSGNSRLYCYKMNDYKDSKKLKEMLPHRSLSDNDWETLSNNIGWITYDDFWKYSDQFSLIKDPNEKKEIEQFFIDRNLK
jgi:hypothetical protein